MLREWDTEHGKQFIEALKSLDDYKVVKVRLLSCCHGSLRAEEFVADVVYWNFHEYVDSIVVTSQQTMQDWRSEHQLEDTVGEEMTFEPFPHRRRHASTLVPCDQQQMAEWAIARGDSLVEADRLWNMSEPYVVKYTRFVGGKDEYIARQYRKEARHFRQRIVVLDNMTETVECLNKLTERCDCGHNLSTVPLRAIYFPTGQYTYYRMRDAVRKVIRTTSWSRR